MYFCLRPIQLTYFCISDAKQKITLTLETKENKTLCLKLGKKKLINDAEITSCSYLVQAQRLSYRTTQPEELPHYTNEV